MRLRVQRLVERAVPNRVLAIPVAEMPQKYQLCTDYLLYSAVITTTQCHLREEEEEARTCGRHREHLGGYRRLLLQSRMI